MAAADESMAGKIVLITGATQGIGRATAHALGRRGATLCLVARDEGRGNDVAAKISAETGREVALIVADLAKLVDVARAADEFAAKFGRLDVLVNNAGAIFPTRKLTDDGIERTFALNHLAYFGLTCRLRRLLEQSAPSRIVNVSSSLHAQGRIDFDDLHGERGYRGGKAYSQSKLANVLFTYELARRLAGSGVTANCLHPGVVRTGFGKNEPGLMSFFVKVAAPFLISEDEGAKTSIYLASSPEVDGVTGAYFVKCRRRPTSKLSYDAEVAKRLWEVSESMTGVSWAG